MPVDFAAIDLAALSLEQVRALLPPWLAASVTPALGPAIDGAVRDLLRATSDPDLAQAVATMSTLGAEHRPYDADPFARRLSRAYIGQIVTPGSVAHGTDRLRAALSAGPTLLLGNHRSYVDTQLTDLLLCRQDPSLADRLVTVAGPKVYVDPFRRIAALGLHTIKTAQSTTVATEGAALSGRQVARVAVQTVQQAHTLMRQGHAALLYPEGTRSRDGGLGPFLRGAGRYARLSGTQVLPVALLGSEAVFPIDASQLQPGLVTLRFGEPFAAEGLDRDAVLRRARDQLLEILGR